MAPYDRRPQVKMSSTPIHKRVKQSKFKYHAPIDVFAKNEID